VQSAFGVVQLPHGETLCLSTLRIQRWLDEFNDEFNNDEFNERTAKKPAVRVAQCFSFFFTTWTRLLNSVAAGITGRHS